MGETTLATRSESQQPVGLDTYAGKIHVEWDPQAAVTPLGQLPFFISFLGNEGFLSEAENRCAHYLTKLRLTANVKRCITRLFAASWG